MPGPFPFWSLLRTVIGTSAPLGPVSYTHLIPVQRSWRLNERHYGALQGKDKKAIRDEYGDEQFMLWRRSYSTPPPEIELGSEFSQDQDPRYCGEPIPRTECLEQVLERLLPYWEEAIVPELKSGKTAVSYTHLDVYKRQEPACRWIYGGLLILCSLTRERSSSQLSGISSLGGCWGNRYYWSPAQMCIRDRP